MPFKIALTPTCKVKVQVEIPNDRGGIDRSEFNAEFKRTGAEEIEQGSAKTFLEFTKEKLVGWSDLLDEANQKVDFNELNMRALFDIPQARDALVNAWRSTIVQAKKGN